MTLVHNLHHISGTQHVSSQNFISRIVLNVGNFFSPFYSAFTGGNRFLRFSRKDKNI